MADQKLSKRSYESKLEKLKSILIISRKKFMATRKVLKSQLSENKITKKQYKKAITKLRNRRKTVKSIGKKTFNRKVKIL